MNKSRSEPTHLVCHVRSILRQSFSSLDSIPERPVKAVQCAHIQRPPMYCLLRQLLKSGRVYHRHDMRYCSEMQ
jgi:hypothetical protein